MVEIKVNSAYLLFCDGVGLRYHAEMDKRPKKHQLLIEFEDQTAISAAVRMYGGLWCFCDGELENPYYTTARQKPSPLTTEFDEQYFSALISPTPMQKLSAKAFLATEQRIPGLGNGVLQDILWHARIHPKRKINTLSPEETHQMLRSVRTVLFEMVELGGRDTEKDLFGKNGRYITKMSKNTSGSACSNCGGLIIKETFLGGSIYYCPNCQLI